MVFVELASFTKTSSIDPKTVGPGVQGADPPPPDLGRSVNPISQSRGGGQIMPKVHTDLNHATYITARPTRFSDFLMALQYSTAASWDSLLTVAGQIIMMILNEMG